MTSIESSPISHSYRGRFAPTPSGPLHFGSLIAATGSYLQAKSQQGKWLLRIDDLDTPRVVPGAASQICKTLERYGLHWDETIVYQSQHFERYQAIIETLKQQQLTYYCRCTRKEIKAIGGIYLGHCRKLTNSADQSSIRVRVDQPLDGFFDKLQGEIAVEPHLAEEDFIIRRRDGLYAYNLAVVVDDHQAGITEVVRGADLLSTTVRQRHLYQLMRWPEPDYLHLPLAVESHGHKLSKQNHAPALDLDNPEPQLWLALKFLGLKPPLELHQAPVEEQLEWAGSKWNPAQLPCQREIELSDISRQA
ncbi:tRNA glutamyl-Q(34) synthetase GluQRS [Dongshaea marina]|uniref:tRNA glutamyl-Q(34) synthetase GluQRS n=1 Tax=Dongshaea marina TaxID=2047966 RepID=UPI000D3E9CA9|nr:tRNA glutamyl-Q(34) synthetase GluQRS [Dongshaea marina]